MKKGAELTTHYVPLEELREDRRKELKERFGFDCECACCDSGVRVPFSDARRVHLKHLDGVIYDKASRGKHKAAILDVEERLRLLMDEMLDSPAAVARSCNDAAQAAAHAGDAKAQRTWLERCREASRLCELPGSAELDDLEGRLARLKVRGG